ncbi:MAG: argininosuccinate lyase [Candidatus Saccharibacteria bacterium]|nr:argininosuccinate lyase [Candidatus Saccharibacteria bacterium]
MTNNKLWQSTATGTLHPLIEAYTIGDDQVLDQMLLGHDITATKAHAHMLEKIGVLTHQEYRQLADALDELLHKWQQGEFKLTTEHEDGHTAIELYLTEKLGPIGKKVHTGRSRNDQALVMMRLYIKTELETVVDKLQAVAQAYAGKIASIGQTEMPGYTHTQKAMPSSVGMWLGSYHDAFSDLRQLVTHSIAAIDQNPLGSAAGFGVTLPLDRQMTTDELGFATIQENPMYCGLSRGIFELIAVQALNPIMTFAGKFAEDMLLFTSQEFNYFKLPVTMTTGSSIMPHKRNYDVFEIMRATAHAFPNYAFQLQAIATGAGSGYHRDLQLTKKITMDAFTSALDTLEVLALCVSELEANTERLAEAMTDELYTVAKINELVEKGVPFRDAYQQVKQSYLGA